MCFRRENPLLLARSVSIKKKLHISVHVCSLQLTRRVSGSLSHTCSYTCRYTYTERTPGLNTNKYILCAVHVKFKSNTWLSFPTIPWYFAVKPRGVTMQRTRGDRPHYISITLNLRLFLRAFYSPRLDYFGCKRISGNFR